jgi:hypothetical protein
MVIQAVPGMKERHLSFHWSVISRTSVEEATMPCRTAVEQQSNNGRTTVEAESNKA